MSKRNDLDANGHRLPFNVQEVDEVGKPRKTHAGSHMSLAQAQNAQSRATDHVVCTDCRR